jgi:Ca2+-binding RTX toxin-like protein
MKRLGGVVIVGVLAAVAYTRDYWSEQTLRNLPIAEKNRVARVLWGTDAANRITGSTLPDLIVAFGGNDSINGKKGDDIVFGGRGNDFIVGDSGFDVIFGETGNDSIEGNIGNDTIFGGPGDDEIEALSENDFVDAGPGDDWVNGGLGLDQIFGGPGDDYLWGRWGEDILDGGPGDDTLYGASETNVLIGGPGRDFFHYDIFDTRDNGAYDIIMDFERGVDKIHLNEEVVGIVFRLQDGSRKWTDIRMTDPSGNNDRTVIVEGLWINRNDAETY